MTPGVWLAWLSDRPRVQVNEKVKNPTVKKEKRKNPAKHRKLIFCAPRSRALSVPSHPVVNAMHVSTAFSREPRFSTDKTFNSQ